MAVIRNAEAAHREGVERARLLRDLVIRYRLDLPKAAVLPLLDDFEAALKREARMRAVVLGVSNLWERDPTKETWQNIPAFKTLVQAAIFALSEEE